MENSFGKRLLQLIRDNNLTQKSIAQRVGVTEAAMSHYIKGDRVPRASVLSKIAVELNTTTEYLMEGVPVGGKGEITQLRKLVARNAKQMSLEEKAEIVKMLYDSKE